MLVPRFKILHLLTTIFGCFSIVGCYWERPTQVRLEGPGPVFVLSGSGRLSSFSVYVVSPPDLNFGRTVDSLSLDSFFTQPAVWHIESQADVSDGRVVSDIARLSYGIVPYGYKQSAPLDGLAPPPIAPGRQYFFDCNTVNASGSSGSFQLVNNKVLCSQIHLPCLQARDEKQMTVPCAQSDFGSRSLPNRGTETGLTPLAIPGWGGGGTRTGSGPCRHGECASPSRR